MEEPPGWFTLGDALSWPLIGMAMASARAVRFGDPDLEAMPELAVLHHAGCFGAGLHANREGWHSAAMSLVRQSIEALTVAEIGLQEPGLAVPLLRAWKAGKKSHGELRSALERDVWPNYGKGLWDEPWSEFYGNLAKAVQPYAHYTPKLQGWQMTTLAYAGGREATMAYGLKAYDATKASRITLLHMLLTWMLGRILLLNADNPDVRTREQDIRRLGESLASVKRYPVSRANATSRFARGGVFMVVGSRLVRGL